MAQIDIYTKDFASFDDLLGALKALSHLTNTYKLDWFKLSTLPQSLVTIEDIDNMAIIAYNSKYYDTCVDLLKAAYKLLPQRNEEYKTIKSKMEHQKKTVIRVHNELVMNQGRTETI